MVCTMNKFDSADSAVASQAGSSVEAFRFKTTEKLRNADTDQFGHVNHAVMMSLFEAGRIEILERSEVAAAMRALDLVVARIDFSFHRELRYPAQVQVGSTVARVGTSSFTVRQGLFDTQHCVASGEAVCVLIDRATRRPSAITDDVRSFLLARE